MSRQRIRERIATMSASEIRDLADALGVSATDTESMIDAWLDLASN